MATNEVPRAPEGRRDARLLVGPFCDVFVAAHLGDSAARPTAELLQDISRRGISFVTGREELLSRAADIRAVTLDCPDGLSATLGISRAHVRRPRPNAPAHVALEFTVPRPRFRVPARRMRRLADGFYAPSRREDAPGLIRMLLGADPEAADRRSSDRIRVPLDAGVGVRLLHDGALVAEAILADVAPAGFGAIGAETLSLGAPPDQVELHWKGRRLIARTVQDVFSERAAIRGSERTRLRVLVAPGSGRPWSLPLWAGPQEFGCVRVVDHHSRPSLIQAALLVRDEVVVRQASCSAERDAARRIAYEAFVDDGVADPEATSLEQWRDAFEDRADVLVAMAEDVVMGGIRLIPDGPAGLAYQKYTPQQHWPTDGVRTVEASRLVVSREYRPDVNGRLGVAIKLIAAGFDFCQSKGYERVVMVATTAHERFYRVLGMRPISPAFPHPLAFGIMTRLFELDLTSTRSLGRIMRFAG